MEIIEKDGERYIRSVTDTLFDPEAAKARIEQIRDISARIESQIASMEADVKAMREEEAFLQSAIGGLPDSQESE